MKARRHCSVCGKAGHDKRAHPKRTRRNVDLFTGDDGQVHPIRDSYGYREWLTNSEAGRKEKAKLRDRRKAGGRKPKRNPPKSARQPLLSKRQRQLMSWFVPGMPPL